MLHLMGSSLSAVIAATGLGSLYRSNGFDAVVIGAGAAGGLAALLLTEAGLRVLVLNAGGAGERRSFSQRIIGGTVRQLTQPSTLKYIPPRLAFKGRAALKVLARGRQRVQSRCYAWERAPEAFVDDVDCPYTTPPDRPFNWFRSRQLGGRMTVPGHGRQYYRFNARDFLSEDGLSPKWPFGPTELSPWYTLVERRLELAGTYEGLSSVPDSEISEPLVPSPAEKSLCMAICRRWPQARPVLGRYAPPLNSLELAACTGRLSLREGAVARELEVDGSGAVRAVTFVDQGADTVIRVPARLVFLCASALESTRLLLLSRSPRNPSGIGGDSGVLGRFLMDHVMMKAEGMGPELPPGPVVADGRCLYLPRFDTRSGEAADESGTRGFGVQVYQFPAGGRRSYFTAVGFAEMLPAYTNRVRLDASRCDAWGIPALDIDCRYGERDLAVAAELAVALRELADVAQADITSLDESPPPPGSANHECGTARMGTDRTNSVLDPYNECWDARGLYVTDGACFPAQGSQNPTLTILALTARACDHALRQSGAASTAEKIIAAPDLQ
jgi:choline dehydrogenase-like flavoprotein